MTSDLKGKVVLIPGASPGIGAAAARAFARAGSKVVIHYNASRDAAERVAADVTMDELADVAVRTLALGKVRTLHVRIRAGGALAAGAARVVFARPRHFCRNFLLFFFEVR